MNVAGDSRGRPAVKGKNGKTIRETVLAVLDQFGDQTSIAVIAQRVATEMQRSVTHASVGNYRKEWRRNKDSKNDCRTYAGQPRRNMLNDHDWNNQHVKRVMKFFDKKAFDVLTALFADGIGQFHSIDQLKNCVETIQELKAA